MKTYRNFAATALAILSLSATASVLAADRAEIDKNVTTTLVEFKALSPSYGNLIEKAAGTLVFPQVTKGGVGVAGEYGEGVLQVKGKTVDYYSIGAVSVGLTLGLARHSEVLMFMTQDALDKFTTSGGWSIGADAGITVMSQGTSGEYDTKTQQKPVLAFAFSEKGLIGDLSLEGAKITKITK